MFSCCACTDPYPQSPTPTPSTISALSPCESSSMCNRAARFQKITDIPKLFSRQRSPILSTLYSTFTRRRRRDRGCCNALFRCHLGAAQPHNKCPRPCGHLPPLGGRHQRARQCRWRHSVDRGVTLPPGCAIRHDLVQLWPGVVVRLRGHDRRRRPPLAHAGRLVVWLLHHDQAVDSDLP